MRGSNKSSMVRLEGFEPSHPVPETGALSPELQAQVSGDPVGIRTLDPQLRRLLLYPAELPDHLFQKCCKGTAIH